MASRRGTVIVECAGCGRAQRIDAVFCDGCGKPLGGDAPPAPDEPVRKTVTALFCDLVGSTSFGERVDPESAREAMGRYFAMARAVVEDHDGTVAKFVGDGLLALFGVPEVGPDDAERAVRAGVALQAGFGEIRDHIASRHHVDVGLRVGINTGEVVIAHGDADIIGDAINTAARLETACSPGRVLVGEPTYRLSRGALSFAERGRIDAKGKEEPVEAFEVADTPEVAGTGDVVTPFVGREDELRRLEVVFEQAVLDRRAALVSIIGSPGVGKSRLARELRAAVGDDVETFGLRCERSGTATFAPIADLLRTAAGIEDDAAATDVAARIQNLVAGLDDRERVSDLLRGFLGEGPVRSPEEMFFAARRLVQLIGAAQPVLLVVDDIQWAEPLFLDLLEHLVEWVQSVPLLIVCLARPEIREVRPRLAEPGRWVAEVMDLEGLGADAAAELAALLVGTGSLPPELVARIPESTEGNPLFIRELMRMLVDDGVISDASGNWEMVIDVEAVEVPPTINSLLASRVERLSPEERRILELAAVVGAEFPIGAVEAIGDTSREHLEAILDRLRRQELVEPTGTLWGRDPIFRFHHVLIRDAAYRRLLKGVRAERHSSVGAWTEQTAAGLVGEHEVSIAHHFEEAYRYRLELDLDDDEAAALGARAARLLHVAAARALEREDLAAAGSLARRALHCVGDDDDDIAELLLLGCEAVLGVGDVNRGAPLVDRLASVAGDDPRLRAWVDCFRAQVAVFVDPDGLHDAERMADAAAETLAQLGDQAGVAKARIERAGALVRLARVGECEDELDAALTAARAVDDRRRVTAVLGNAPIAALWGPSPVPRAGGRCLDVVRLLRSTPGSPAVEATAIRCQAVLEAHRGRFDTARSMLESARATVEELGLTHDLLETEYYAGLVELLAGEPAAAEPLLRKAHDGLGRMGIGADRGQAGAQLARALLLQGRLADAEKLVLESEGLAGQNRQTVIASRSVHAEILAAQGRHHEAMAFAEEAVAGASGTDILIDHANAMAARSRVLAAAGDAAGARDAADAANALYEQKGASIRIDAGRHGLLGAEAAAGDAPRVEHRGSPAPGSDGGWNRADLLTREWAVTSDVSELLQPGVEFEDRRRIVADPGDERAVLAAMRDNVTAQHVHSVETIAVRGDLLSLHCMTWRSDDGSDLEWELLTTAAFNDDGSPARAVVYEVEQLDEALAELHRLHVASLDHAGEDVELALSERMQARGVHLSTGDLVAIAGGIAEDVVFVDHRPASFGTAHGRDRLMEGIARMYAEIDECLAYVEKIHAVANGVVCFSDCYRLTSTHGAEIADRRQVVQCHDETGLTRIEEFAADAVGDALARWAALVDERT